MHCFNKNTARFLAFLEHKAWAEKQDRDALARGFVGEPLGAPSWPHWCDFWETLNTLLSVCGEPQP